jgi:hypothetical protein
MQTSEAITDLAKSLAKAQGQISNAIKNSANPHFKSRYADLAAIWDTIRDPLSSNGLSILQTVNFNASERGGEVVINTMLLHESGQWIKDQLSIPIFKVDAQAIGSASTYGRRYSLQSIAGVAGEDDDGNAASGKGAAPPVATISDKQQAEILALLKKLGKEEAAFAAHMGVATIAEIPAISFQNATAILKRIEAKAQQEKKNEESPAPTGQ